MDCVPEVFCFDDGGEQKYRMSVEERCQCILPQFVKGLCAVGVLGALIVLTSVLLPRLARLNACRLPNQSPGFGKASQ